ncbi:MAG: ABC transporter permease [Pseudomonadota bacterium]
MALAFEGEDSDTALLREIEKHTKTHWQIPQDNSIEGIIISERALRELGWTPQNKPHFLWVHLTSETQKKYRQDVPLKILAVVEKLPYQRPYVMSLGQYARLKTRIYHKPIKGGFDIGYPDKLKDYEKEKQLIEKKLPPRSTVYGPNKSGEMTILRITLKQPISWLDVITKFVVPTPQKRLITVPITDRMWDAIHYKGGIFHLNQKVLENQTLAKKLPRTLQEFMEEKNVRVRGELIQALQEAFQDQGNLAKMRNLFKAGTILLLGILLVFFSIVLHTRLNRIGILRMLGVPKIAFVITYILSALFFVALAFILASTLLFFIMPTEITSYLYSVDTIILLASISSFAILGMLLPTLYFLRQLPPSEMLSYSF